MELRKVLVVVSAQTDAINFNVAHEKLMKFKESLNKVYAIEKVEFSFGVFNGKLEENIIITAVHDTRHIDGLVNAICIRAFAELEQDSIMVVEENTTDRFTYLHGVDSDWQLWAQLIGMLKQVPTYRGGNATYIQGEWYVAHKGTLSH